MGLGFSMGSTDRQASGKREYERHDHAEISPQPVREIRPDVSEGVEHLLATMLARLLRRAKRVRKICMRTHICTHDPRPRREDAIMSGKTGLRLVILIVFSAIWPPLA